MSQHAVITDGFGTFGSPSLVITEGYSSLEVVARWEVLRLESGITQEISVDSSITVTLNTESAIKTDMALSSRIDLEE